jgi:hypothetical protein
MPPRAAERTKEGLEKWAEMAVRGGLPDLDSLAGVPGTADGPGLPGQQEPARRRGSSEDHSADEDAAPAQDQPLSLDLG